MVNVHTPPNNAYPYEHGCKLFLAGTIDQGESFNWQKVVIEYLDARYPLCQIDVFNPRRDDWNPLWNNARDPRLRRQIEWELKYLEQADFIAMVLLEDSKSPISLLELGLFKDKKMIVYCPYGFYRKLNIDVTCSKYNIDVYEDWDMYLIALKRLTEGFLLKNSKF